MTRARLVVRLGLAVLAIGLAFDSAPRAGAAAPAGGFVGRGEIAIRERANSVTSITSSVLEQLPSSRRIEEVLTQLPTDRRVTPGHLPPGWSAEQKGKQIRAWGPGLPAVRLRYDLDGNYASDYAGKSATIQAKFDGRFDAPYKLTISTLPKVSVTPDLDGILTLPPQAVAGQPLAIGVAPGYRDGPWVLQTSGDTLPLMPADALRDVEVIKSTLPALYSASSTSGVMTLLTKPEPRPFITVLPAGDRITGARYTDPWGEVLVDAPVTIAATAPPAGSRWIGGGSDLTFAGQAACVSGRFPTFDDAYGLLLDRKIELQPWGVSPTSVMLGIPDDTAAGPHTISTPDGSSSITIGVLRVEGSLDQNKLWRGESTTMRLRVVGTDRQFPLAVLNRTPEIITVAGGTRQVVTTPGGSDNAVTRSVTGIRRGNFTIVYSVNSPGCGAGAGR
jgi:hypothetical protein